MLHFNVTDHPPSALVAQQMVEALADGEPPRYLIRDRDGVYGLEVSRRHLGLEKQCPIERRIMDHGSFVQVPELGRLASSLNRYLFANDASLLAPQRYDRIHPRRAPGGKKAAKECDRAQ